MSGLLRQRSKKRKRLDLSDTDVILSFTHNSVKNPSSLKIRNIGTQSSGAVLSVDDEVSDTVKQIGIEANNVGEGFDYAIAVVNKSTGATTYRPARFFSFGARSKTDVDKMLIVKDAIPDFTSNHNFDSADYSANRSRLTENFGSSKKLKIQEAAVRRSIHQDTLNAMVQTAFSSASVIAKTEDAKLEQITTLQKVESSLLPRPVETAILGCDVYPLSLFISDEEVKSFKDVCKTYMETRSDSEFPNTVEMIVWGLKDDKRLVGFCLLGCMVTFLETLGRSFGITHKTVHEFKFPKEIVGKVQMEFIGTETQTGKMNASKLFVGPTQKSKLQAFTLALALTLSNGTFLPVSPWIDSLKTPAKIVEKVLMGLGCEISGCTSEESKRYNTLRIARLHKPPTNDFKNLRKIRR